MESKPKSRLWWAGVIFLFFTTTGVLGFGYKYLDRVVRQEPAPVLSPLVEEMTGAYGSALLLPVLYWIARRFPFKRRNWPRLIALHLGVVIAGSFLHTSWNAVSRMAVFPLLGLGLYDYGVMPYRYAMEFPNDVIGYISTMGVLYLFLHYREARRRELAMAQLETRLAEAKLHNLRLQLHPHFLFNALNTISSVMYDDVRKADAMLAGLSELLRRTLTASTAQEIPLEEELTLTGLYLEIMQARLEERLAVEQEIEPAAKRALVPQLLLQPLVENAIRHGANPGSGMVKIRLTAQCEEDSLLIRLRDWGRGLPASANGFPSGGVGLSNTADRLHALYGESCELRLDNQPDGGLCATVKIPLRWSDRSKAEMKAEIEGVHREVSPQIT
jgi:two-component sensor histidine kinase